MDQSQHIDRLVAALDNWLGGAVVPPWFDPAPGETVLAVFPGVELIELRETGLPLVGGSSTLDVATASAMATATTVVTRSIWLKETVPARETGAAVITSERVVFVGDRQRSWRFEELHDLTHDNGVPETWFAVSSRKRLSGLRYGGGAALDLRFVISLAIATARDDRPALRAWLLSQRPAMSPSWGAGAPAAAAAPAWLRKTKRGLSLVYLGKSGTPLPLRVAQGTVAGVATLALLTSVMPDAGTTDVELSAAQNRPDSVDEAAQQAEIDAKKAADEAARVAAEEEARKAEEAARLAAEEEARKAAEEQARLAAEEAARVAAEQKAADERAAAERAAAEAAAAEAARAAAERQAAATAQESTTSSGGGCMPEYPDFCIPSGPDLDCPDIGRKNFTVRRPDTFRFDADNDGVGCES